MKFFLTLAGAACGMFLFTLAATARADDPPPPPHHRGPPPEALAACQSLAAGNACSFTLGERTLSGACYAPEGRPLACRPSTMPLPPAPTGSK
ncbi:MAG: hypothetical protein JSR18_12145 [Proteobacteria bacterium]|nr:hypothetical protein [Pseudomonadota bacterium]